MRKTICFVGGGLKGGGQERALTSLANYAAAHDYDVIILNLFKTDIFFELHPEIKLIWPKIEREKLNRFVYALSLIPFIRKEIKKHKPDVVICFGEWFNAYTILSTRFLGIKVFVSNRMGPMLKLGFLLDTANKLLYRYADGVIAQTNTAKDIISIKGPNKNIRVIPNAVIPIEANQFSKKNQIVTVGRLSKAKNHILLVRSFAKLNNSLWTLHIIGDGEERYNLECEVRKLGIEKKVIFYGQQKEFGSILSESEIFVLSSVFEGFPNALVEAMSVPLACISTNCIAGPSDIIQDGVNGILVKPNDIDEMTEAINRLVQDQKLRNELSDEAYKVREKYHFDTVAKQYLAFIQPESQ